MRLLCRRLRRRPRRRAHRYSGPTPAAVGNRATGGNKPFDPAQMHGSKGSNTPVWSFIPLALKTYAVPVFAADLLTGQVIHLA